MTQRQPRKQELRSKPLHIQVSNIKKNSKSVSIIRVNTIVLNGVLMNCQASAAFHADPSLGC